MVKKSFLILGFALLISNFLFAQISYSGHQSITTDADSTILCGDLNGDGFEDLLVLSSSYSVNNSLDEYHKLIWFPNNGQGGFENDGIVIDPTVEHYDAVHLLDLDNDNHLDIVFKIYGNAIWYRNEGQGYFSSPNILLSNDAESIIIFKDYNNDDYTDMIVSYYNNLQIYYFYENDGQANFSNTPIQLLVNSDIFLNGLLEVHDIDNDNDNDLIFKSYSANNENSISIFTNDGDNNFEETTLINDINLSDNQKPIQFEDIDNNGFDDIVYLKYFDNFEYQINCYHNNNGMFGEKQTIYTNNNNSYDLIFKMKDIDNDQDKDLIIKKTVVHPSNFIDYTISYLENDGEGNFSQETFILETNNRINDFVFTDIDNDLDYDLVFSEHNSGLRVFENNIINITPPILSDYTIWTNTTYTTVGEEIEIPIYSSTLSSNEQIISYDFNFAFNDTKLAYAGYSLEGTVADGGSVSINNLGEILDIGYMTETALQGEHKILKLRFYVLEEEYSEIIITDFYYNNTPINDIQNSAVHISPVMNYVYGDVDVNEMINSYDAALTLQYSVGLEPLPQIDPLPWENWRKIVANVDGLGEITSNDASLILQYATSIINIFPVENMDKNTSADETSLNYVITENEIQVYTNSNYVVAFNLSFEENNDITLGNPIFEGDYLTAQNINNEDYKLALCTNLPIEESTLVVRIPYTLNTTNVNIELSSIVNGAENNMSLSMTPTNTIDVAKTAFGIYPNPAKNQLFVRNITDDQIIYIYNAQGQLVLETLINGSKAIDISGLDKGIYMLKVQNEQEVMSSKFVKK